jgi:hypothetical protein
MNTYETPRVSTGLISSNLTVYFSVKHANTEGKVRLQIYLSMPHVFPVFSSHPSAKTCYKEIGDFIKTVVHGESFESCAEIIKGDGIIERGEFDLERYSINFDKPQVLCFYDVVNDLVASENERCDCRKRIKGIQK